MAPSSVKGVSMTGMMPSILFDMVLVPVGIED
jgi:hypothetical protein